MSDVEVAQRYDRCTKCGRHYGDASERAAHVSQCKGQSDKNGVNLFPSRIGKVRKFVAEGREADVNKFGNKFSKPGGRKFDNGPKKVSFSK